MMTMAKASEMALEIQMESPSGSAKRNHKSDSAIQMTTDMKRRSNQLVSIGKKPGFLGSSDIAYPFTAPNVSPATMCR